MAEIFMALGSDHSFLLQMDTRLTRRLQTLRWSLRTSMLEVKGWRRKSEGG